MVRPWLVEQFVVWWKGSWDRLFGRMASGPRLPRHTISSSQRMARRHHGGNHASQSSYNKFHTRRSSVWCRERGSAQKREVDCMCLTNHSNLDMGETRPFPQHSLLGANSLSLKYSMFSSARLSSCYRNTPRLVLAHGTEQVGVEVRRVPACL